MLARCLEEKLAKLDNVLKSRDNILSTKSHIVKAIVFPVVMYRWESWTIKMAEHWKTDASKLWCWRSLLRVPWRAKRSNPSVLEEINPEYSLKGLMLKFQYLATWYEDPTHWKRPCCWERLKVGREKEDRGWNGWKTSQTQWTWIWANSRRW